MSSNKEMWFCWMELHCLNNTLCLSEWSLWWSFTKRMDYHLLRWLQVVCHCWEVVSLGVPYYLLDNVTECNLNHFLTSWIIFPWPFQVLFFLVIGKNILLILLLCHCKYGVSTFINVMCIQLWLYQINKLFIGCWNNTGIATWTPFNAINNIIR